MCPVESRATNSSLIDVIGGAIVVSERGLSKGVGMVGADNTFEEGFLFGVGICTERFDVIFLQVSEVSNGTRGLAYFPVRVGTIIVSGFSECL